MDGNENLDTDDNLRYKSISAIQQWKISCISIYGDVIVAATSLGGKIFIIRLDTGIEHRSRPDKLPLLLTLQMLSYTDVSPILSSGILHCNLWHLPGSYAWDWQSITLIHRTGAAYR